MLIGAHTSASGGVFNALYQGKEIGANTVQLFTSNQKQWKGKTFSPDELQEWKRALELTGIEKVMSHDSYLINLGSVDPEILQKSRTAFKEEIIRCQLLGIELLNFHPGAATRGTLEECLDLIVESLLGYEPLLAKGKTRLLLETTAGQGTSVGHRFEQLAYILDRTEEKIPIGVCIDTCHIFAAGYDIRTANAWENVLDQFDKIIGLKRLFAFHVNDSQKDLGTRVDRHANLGEGLIGLESFAFLMSCPKLSHLPKYLETPIGPEGWKKEIALLRSFHEELKIDKPASKRL